MKKWLMLRGAFDERTQKSIDNNDDMWMNLFNELCSNGDWIWFYEKLPNDVILKLLNRNMGESEKYNTKCDMISSSVEYLIENMSQPDFIFCRGAFDYYLPILKKWKDSYIIRYSAGRRIMPESDIAYNLILCDSDNQKQQILKRYPKANVHKFIKPAAWHFKSVSNCDICIDKKCKEPFKRDFCPYFKKEYDVCYIANETQGHFKGIQWVYDTAPKELKILHLGNFTGRYKAPANVTRKHVDRIDMPKWISKCKVGIVPYWNQIDSCPRIIPEMLACGLPLVIANELNFWDTKYYFQTFFSGNEKNIIREIYLPTNTSSLAPKDSSMVYYNLNRTSKEKFWPFVQLKLFTHYEGGNPCQDEFVKYYQDNLSIPIAAKYIKDLINEN